jgi:Fe-S-cluster-containing dehydrogenase component
MQWAIHIDRDRRIGCYSCIVACKLEHNLPPYPAHPPLGNPTGPALIRVYQFGPVVRDDAVQQYFEPILCMHCIDAPCIPACPQSALYKDDETGITLVNRDDCEGCESCLEACPYKAPQLYDGKVYLCDLCIHRLAEGGREPGDTACQAICPARAIHVGPVDLISTMPRGEARALGGERAIGRPVSGMAE